MSAKLSNPRVSDLLLALTAVEVLVLLASGGGLFFLPDFLPEIWPWTVAPFNAGFLGAVYLASLVSAAALVYLGRWSPARVVTPMILIFTAVLLVLTFLYLDIFILSNPFTWVWLGLYTIIPINAAYHIWLYRKLPPARPQPLASPWRQAAVVLGIGYALYGIGLLVAPGPFSDFWPWEIDDFHARIYSVAFLTPALGLLLLSRAAAWAEALTLGLTLAAGGLLPVVALVKVDLLLGRVDYAAADTWLWVALFSVLFASGIGLLRLAADLPRPAAPLNAGGFVVSPRLASLAVGVAFTAAGIAGFLPAFTLAPPQGAPPLLVHHSYGYLLGLFPVNIVHNLFHLLIGILGIAFAWKQSAALLYLRGFALSLAALTLAGLLPGFNAMFGFAPVYGHDVWLHGIEALAAGYISFLMPARRAAEAELGQHAALTRS